MSNCCLSLGYVPEGSGASYRTCKLVKTRADLTKARKNDELAKKKDVPEL